MSPAKRRSTATITVTGAGPMGARAEPVIGRWRRRETNDPPEKDTSPNAAHGTRHRRDVPASVPQTDSGGRRAPQAIRSPTDPDPGRRPGLGRGRPGPPAPGRRRGGAWTRALRGGDRGPGP